MEAHRLRSSASNLAAPALSSLCQRLEPCARAGDLSRAPRLVAELQHEFGGVARALQRYADRAAHLDSSSRNPISSAEPVLS